MSRTKQIETNNKFANNIALKAKFPFGEKTEKGEWKFKYLRVLRNPRYNDSLWLINVVDYLPLSGDTIDIIQGRLFHGIRIKGYDGSYDTPDVKKGVNELLENVFNKDGRKIFNMYMDDEVSRIGVSEYYTISEFARHHKLRINKRKMSVEYAKRKRR